MMFIQYTCSRCHSVVCNDEFRITEPCHEKMGLRGILGQRMPDETVHSARIDSSACTNCQNQEVP